MIFVIPTKYDPARPVVFDCVRAVRTHHPDARVVIVDSASDDRSYYEPMLELGAEVADIENRHYPTAAFGWALHAYPTERFFGCIFDSLIVNAPLDHLLAFPLTTVRHFLTPPTGWGEDQFGVSLSRWAEDHSPFPIPDQFVGVFGPMWFCDRQVLEQLDRCGFFDIHPTDKWQACAMERLAGIVLTELGYDPTNSLQGEMHGYWDDYDDTFVTKTAMARA